MTATLVTVIAVSATVGVTQYVGHSKEVSINSIQSEVDDGRQLVNINGDVEDGSLPFESKEQIENRLQKKVEESMLNIKINTNPIFENCNSEGTLAIENSISNRYKFQVEITLDDGGDLLYTSPVIEPGHHIMTAKLDKNLDKGIYSATARFFAYTDDNVFVGQVGAGLKIQILN